MKFSLQKLQSYITEPLPSVEILREKIIFHAFEVESIEATGEDFELDIKVLPDRAGDAKDERGMAREIAALFGLTLKEPDQYEQGASVTCSLEKISNLLGRMITIDEVKKVFDAYHYHYEITDNKIVFFVPPWRNDIQNVHDLADEVGRFVGYDTIPAILPNLTGTTVINQEFSAVTAKKQELIAKGYNEVMTYSLVKKGDFQVAKGPKGKDFLRTNLLDELRKAYTLNKQNEVLLPNASANIFEIGKVFLKSGEELHVAWIDTKEEHEEILNLTRSADAAHPLHCRGEGKRFVMWSEYPFITRDISFWANNTDEDVVLWINNNIQNINKDSFHLTINVFDKFTKNERTSYGFRLIFQSWERTLTNEEIDVVMEKVYTEVKAKGWEVR
jgi:phenylalanyl-tRNA synthetase beta subunit